LTGKQTFECAFAVCKVLAGFLDPDAKGQGVRERLSLKKLSLVEGQAGEDPFPAPDAPRGRVEDGATGRREIRKKPENVYRAFAIVSGRQEHPQGVPVLLDGRTAFRSPGDDEKELAQVGPSATFRKGRPQEGRNFGAGPVSSGNGQPGQQGGRLVENGGGHPGTSQPDFGASQEFQDQRSVGLGSIGCGHVRILRKMAPEQN
jgi:hypothetical protein